ncbi:MAG: NAD(P)-dependent oxidoreductase [Actinomycetota bacterium]
MITSDQDALRTVLVTGAFGQIGTFCTRLLLQRGLKVVAVDLRNDGTEKAARQLAAAGDPGQLVPAHVDLLDRESIRHLHREHNPNAIVHLAAMFAPASYRDPIRARRINVEGTRNLVDAAATMPLKPLMVFASSASVYGSINPYLHPERITALTAVNPVDQYGEDKVLAEMVITESDMPWSILRLAGVMSPAAVANANPDYRLLLRATPGDNRMHSVDARDVGLAFANAVDRRQEVTGRVLLIGGDDSHLHIHRDFEDDLLTAFGVGPLGRSASLPGDRADERGWAFTGWFDTAEAQSLLQFQRHRWAETTDWMARSFGRRRMLTRSFSPVLRAGLRAQLAFQRRIERRGAFADPWTLISQKYGPGALASPAGGRASALPVRR